MMKRITAAVGLLVVSALALTAPLSATLDDSAARLPEVEALGATTMVVVNSPTPPAGVRSTSPTLSNCIDSNQPATALSCPEDEEFRNQVIAQISQACGSDDFIIWHMDCAVIGGSIIIHAHVTCLYWE
ncbi:hypothetical protein [Candidatus Palauibacter sp.]|uniref:hypothetical protein n=1 Tax=Candidatus Palauibacter sp. TaxID=3101350 RepID=UPI003AF237C2